MPDIDDPILAKALELAPPLHDDPILAKALSLAPPKSASSIPTTIAMPSGNMSRSILGEGESVASDTGHEINRGTQEAADLRQSAAQQLAAKGIGVGDNRPRYLQKQVSDLAKEESYVDVPGLRELQLGLRQAGNAGIGLLARAGEIAGLTDPGTTDAQMRINQAIDERAKQSPHEMKVLSPVLRGITNALTQAYVGGALGEAAGIGKSAGTVAAFVADGANSRYSETKDLGDSARAGLINGMTGMLFPEGKAVEAGVLKTYVANLAHTAPVLVTQHTLAKLNDALAGKGEVTPEEFATLAANIFLFPVASTAMQKFPSKADRGGLSRKEFERQNAQEQTQPAQTEATQPEVVVPKSAAGNPFGVDITQDSQPRTAETPQQEAAAASESPRSEEKLNVVSPEPPEDLNARLRQRIKDAQAKPSPDDAVGIKHADVDKQREARGQEGLPETIPISDKATEAEANRRMKEDPFAVDKIIVDLKATKRAASDVENVMLTRRYTELLNAHDEAVTKTAEAINAKDSEKSASYGDEANKLNSVLTDFEDVTDMAGSQAGRDLRARRFMMNRDYSLRQMTAERTVDKGRPLTPEEHEEIVKAHAKIADLEKQVETMRANVQTNAVDEAVKTVKQRVTDTTKPKPKKLAQRITETLDKAAADAEARMKARGFRALAGIPVEDIADMSIIAAAQISKGVVNVADFMVKTYGEKIRPHLREILAKAKERVEEHTRLITRDDVLARLKEKTAAGELGTITQDLRKIAEGVYHEGHQERDAMIDRVHEITKGATGLTRDKTAMAFSGLGQFRPLDNEAAKVKVRQNYAEQQSLEKLKLLAEGLIPPKTGMEREKFTETKKALEKKVRAEMKRLGIASVDPETQLASAIDRRIESLKRQTADYRERLAKNDFEPMNKKNPVRNDEIYKLEVELKHVKDKYQSERLKDKLAHRTPYEKIVDAATGYARDIGALSYPTVAGKLGAAAVARGGMTVAEDAVGAGLRRIAPNIAAKANVEGGPASRAQYAQAWKGVKEGYSTQLKQLWRNGKMDIDVLYGKNKDGPKSKFMAFWGLTHAMLKSGVKQGIFERTTQRLIEDAVRRGLDPHSPQLQEAIGIRAYQEANRSIFLQDNYLSNKVKMAFAAQVAKGEAHPSVGAKTLELVGKVAVPIVRVPTNIIAETFSHLAGAEVAGGYAAFKYFRGDIEKLTPEQANDIMRNLKKGVIGNAAVLLGYSLAGSIGGFYQRDKKLKGGLEPNTLAGSHGLGVLLHSPIGLAMQFGANLHHVMDKQGLVSAVGNSLVGTVENVPFVRETLDISRMLEASDPLSEFGVQMGKHFIPGIVQKTAEWTDRAPDRKAKGPAQRFEKMLPILRERLPAQNKQ